MAQLSHPPLSGPATSGWTFFWLPLKASISNCKIVSIPLELEKMETLFKLTITSSNLNLPSPSQNLVTNLSTPRGRGQLMLGMNSHYGRSTLSLSVCLPLEPNLSSWRQVWISAAPRSTNRSPLTSQQVPWTTRQLHTNSNLPTSVME